MTTHRAPCAIEVQSLSKTYGSTQALNQVNLGIPPGQMVALIGPSGSGKSTLLRHIPALITSDRTGGEVKIFGRAIQRQGRLVANARDLRRQVGFIFQQFNLVGRLTLLQNVGAGMLSTMPLWRMMLYYFVQAEKLRALAALHEVGLAPQALQRANTLSGGQQQRGAIARALVQQAGIICADEPIASLDPQSAGAVMQALKRLNRDHGCTVVVSLHQLAFARQYCERVVGMRAGRVVFDGPVQELDDVALRTIYGNHLDELEQSLGEAVAEGGYGAAEEQEMSAVNGYCKGS